MSIIRKYKIYKNFNTGLNKDELKNIQTILTYITFKKNNYKMIEFIYWSLFNLNKVELLNIEDSIFYFKDEKLHFEHDLKKKSININDDMILSHFINEDYFTNNILHIVRIIIQDSYNVGRITLGKFDTLKTRAVEQMLMKQSI